MIPKIIHYTWFSGDPFPQLIQDCIDSWHRYMPEYEYILWDSEKIKEIHSQWLDECITQRKWAFAADLVRMYAVYQYGGIYLDTDCKVYKSFDPLLNEHSFIGKENSIHVEGRSTEMYLTSHCFGAEKGDEFVGRCLSYYNNRPFIMSEDMSLPMKLKFNVLLLPFIQSEIAKQYGYNPNPSANILQHLEKSVNVYPSEYFDSIKVTDNTFCRHLALGGWRDQRTPDEKITLGYKIKWRLEAILRRICESMGYMLVKKR